MEKGIWDKGYGIRRAYLLLAMTKPRADLHGPDYLPPSEEGGYAGEASPALRAPSSEKRACALSLIPYPLSLEGLII